jgi:outer membrane translocation and assembly module TamA
MGRSTQQLQATNVLGVQSQLQYRVAKNIYLIGGWDVAHLSDTWTFNISQERMEHGFSVGLGATSIVGPIELSLSTSDFSENYALKIDVGYQF